MYLQNTGRPISQIELWDWLKRKEVHWAQNSRIKWLKEGDKNTIFFSYDGHHSKKRNCIESLVINGTEVKDPLLNVRQCLISEIYLWSRINTVQLFKASTSKSWMTIKVTISLLLSPMKKLRTLWTPVMVTRPPDPSGFNFKFIKSSWEVIKDDVYKMVAEFWNSSTPLETATTPSSPSFQKVDNPSSFKDYYPISVVGSLYKIIAKILARRLLSVMNTLVGTS